ncbi:hypothetical protein BH23ACT11_BH23ACT11_08060 [soil metagenome]
MTAGPGTKRARFRRFGFSFSKFSVVGFVNAVIDFGVLNLLLLLLPTTDNLQIVLYNLVALVMANLNSYLGNAFWTFRERARSGSRQRVLFSLQAVLNVAVSTGVFWLCIHALLDLTALPPHVGENVAKAVSVTVASLMSFFVMRYLVFSGKKRFGGRL